MVAPGRTYSGGIPYRYGFNGKENDNEVKGTGNQQDYGDRIYDPRVGRWLSIDPSQKRYPGISPYVYTLNNPLIYTDPNGKDPVYTIKSFTSKVVNGVTTINIVFDVTIRGKVINHSSNDYANPKDIADLANSYGSKILSGSGSVQGNEMFYFDGSGRQRKSSASVVVNYTVNVKVDLKPAKDEQGVSKNDDVVILTDNLNKWPTSKNAKDAAGINETIVSGVITKNQMNNSKNAMAVLHETMHGYGLLDAYTRDANGNVDDQAIGNLFGVVQPIEKVDITNQQRGEMVLGLLRIREAMKHGKTDYSGLAGTDAKSETKQKLKP